MSPDQAELAIEVKEENGAGGSYRMHVPCFTAWEIECASLATASPAARSLDGNAAGLSSAHASPTIPGSD